MKENVKLEERPASPVVPGPLIPRRDSVSRRAGRVVMKAARLKIKRVGMKGRWGMLYQVLAVSIVIAGLLGAVELFATRGLAGTRTGRFTVVGNTIYDPLGRVYVIKGVTTVYGTFVGGDVAGLGYTNYQEAQRDFAAQKRLGVNTVRIFVQAANNNDEQKAQLRQVVTWARAEGMVVILTNSVSTAAASLPWLSYLAATYKRDPYVWIEPMNEPNCNPPGNREKCFDWKFWQNEENQYLRAIRGAGMASPVVIDGVSWSWDLSRIDIYPLIDNNVVYSAHRYGNDHAAFDINERQDCGNLWANLATTKAVIVGEVGAWDYAGVLNSLAWTQSFIDFAAEWVHYSSGSGVIAFVWRWSDGNSLVDSSGNLTPWGSWYRAQYLQRVPGTR